ncbi:MAG TPA: hypothetical protein VH437_13050 [Terriglobales bacterium]|jgi:hypothetical protein
MGEKAENFKHWIGAQWWSLYEGAMLESDYRILPDRISDAQAAVIQRRRELLGSPVDLREEIALDEATRKLQILHEIAQRKAYISFLRKTA